MGEMHDALDRFGYTPLILASENGHVGVARALLARGARQQLHRRSDGRAAMHFAAKNGHVRVVKLLCEARGAVAALSLRDSGGHTPLAVATGACAAVLREYSDD